MQVFGLPGHIMRKAKGASRLLASQTPNIEAARRRDALARWRKAMARGLTSEQAAQAVGVARSTLYRWEKRAAPMSRRPRRLRQPGRRQGLAGAVERLRLDHPMWGKEKLGPILRAQGLAASNATVGRIISDLIGRARIQAVPALIRKVAARNAAKKRPHAIRKPKDVTFEKPGDVVQIDTLSIHPLPGVTIKHFTAYDPFAKWTVARPCKQATAKNAAQFLEQVLKQMPDPVKAIQIDGGSEFTAEFEQACADKMLPLYLLPPRSPKTLQRRMAIRVLRLHRSAHANRQNHPVGRRLPAPLQSPQTSRSTCRKNPSPIPLYPPSQRKTPVSYLLSQDRSLTMQAGLLK